MVGGRRASGDDASVVGVNDGFEGCVCGVVGVAWLLVCLAGGACGWGVEGREEMKRVWRR